MGLVDVNKVTELEHPYEPGVQIGVRSLRGTEMDEAREAKVKRTYASWKGDLTEVPDAAKAAKVEVVDTIESRIAQFDVSTLLKYAIKSWSYEAEVSPEAIDNLDSVTREWLAEEVVTRNTRPLPLSIDGGTSLKLVTSQ